jgi:predicted ATPase
LTYLGDAFGKIRLYREWSFGRHTAPRLPQKTDLPNDQLEPDGSNLGLVLNRLRGEPQVKKRLLEALRALYDGIDDFDTLIEGGTVQVFLHEGRITVPATRLSDGTLRYLCLLAILCHPTPPPLVCIEEPELGLHPDVLPTIADLLKEASQRTQLIVTTHSDELVDALTDTPDAVVVAERGESGTTLVRLSADELKPWLEKYRLGQLWTRGEIGGTRW